jgi:transposase
MHRKEDLYQKVIALRYKGFSYNEILSHVPVGRGTISRWCHEILLTKKQKERLIEKKRNTPLIQKRIN